MNLSNLAHAGLALACQIMTALIAKVFGADLFEASVMGALLTSGFYIGREVAQAEGKFGTPPWWSGFQFWKWSVDSKFDAMFPIAGTVLFSVLVFLFF